MQSSERETESSHQIRIPSGIGRSLRLYCSDREGYAWLKEHIRILLRRKDGVPVKSSRFATVLQFLHPKTGEIFYLKEFHDRGIKDKIKKTLRFLRSKRAFQAGELLLKNGFLTPLPVMYGIEKSRCFINKNFLITKGVPGERTYQYFQSRFQLPLSSDKSEEKRALIYAAGQEVGRLHRIGIFHGDLRVGNIIINRRGSSAQFYFIDNEKTRQYAVLPETKRLKNLVQLNMVLLPQITGTDRMRFFKTYIAENPSLLSRKKELLRSIIRITKERHESKL